MPCHRGCQIILPITRVCPTPPYRYILHSLKCHLGFNLYFTFLIYLIIVVSFYEDKKQVPKHITVFTKHQLLTNRYISCIIKIFRKQVKKKNNELIYVRKKKLSPRWVVWLSVTQTPITDLPRTYLSQTPVSNLVSN